MTGGDLVAEPRIPKQRALCCWARASILRASKEPVRSLSGYDTGLSVPRWIARMQSRSDDDPSGRQKQLTPDRKRHARFWLGVYGHDTAHG